MHGRYIYPFLGSLNLDVACFVRNTLRNSSKLDLSQDMKASIKVFHKVHLVFEKQDLITLPLSKFYKIKLQDLIPAFSTKEDYLVIIDTVKDDEKDFGYFPQEHQITYETTNFQRATVLYDQQPAFPRKGKYSPILVLAPKIWVGDDINSYVIFSPFREECDKNIQDNPLEIQLLDEQGKVILKHSEKIALNSIYVFDVKKYLGKNVTEKQRFYNLVSKSGDAIYSIFTIIRNERTGNIAIEHSLPPGYYASGDKVKIRDEALRLAAQ